MEPNESHHHHQQQQHQQHQQQQQQHHQQRLGSPYFHHQLQHHHYPTAVATSTSTGNAVPSSNNGLFPPQPQPNDGSSSIAVYPHSVPSSAVTAPMEPLKRKRGRPRKYVTPEQALAAKKMASSASSSAKERRELAAIAAGTAPSKSGSSKKSQLGSVGKTGQSFIPHIVNIAPGEDVAQKILIFANQSKHELCVLSASGTISNASLRQPASSGGNVSYEGQYEILSLSGSYIRTEQGGKTGGLSASLSGSDGQIIGGAIGTHLTAAGPVQVILGTFQFDRKKDAAGSGVKGDASNSGNQLTSPASTGPILDMGFRPGMESTGRNPMRGHDEQHHHHQTGLSGSHHFMMQAPQGMHMTHTRPSEWGRGGNSGHDGRGGGGYDLSGRLGHESSENGDYEQQIPD
ncbi:hypothetical protein CARUB_v10013864mg [Capsella rubella]|uniref:AT-hook motif nuclear-localized protein n=1 Tax=Capsella rubella TaxID=81985 RepID=R0G5P6_9BRAS|nr:AT-hook motif nuclear-localized protein 14 [Capsella rubella]EOA30721.1 hypothetical protein CARUB_v10013864mg [Capsella rubella]